MAASSRGTSSPAAVQATNDDASASKLSCVKKGYIKDNYVQFFVRRPVKRSPLINRGYFARWAAMRELMMQFLSSTSSSTEELPSTKKQVLSLGAGFDTTFFQLKDEGKEPDLFVELDFLEVTSRKSIIIGSREQMRNHLGSSVMLLPEKGEVIGEHYKLLPCDLRDTKRLDAIFEKAQLNTSSPTLILAECVLIYMDADASRTLTKWLADKFSTAVFVLYEQINADDAFGQQMIKNLESRGCSLLGIYDTSSLEAKKRRFLDLGWERAVAMDMDEIYNCYLDPIEKRRIERLEIFDEFEEWHIMQEHYCVAYGIKDKNNTFSNFGFSAPATQASRIIQPPLV